MNQNTYSTTFIFESGNESALSYVEYLSFELSSGVNELGGKNISYNYRADSKKSNGLTYVNLFLKYDSSNEDHINRIEKFIKTRVNSTGYCYF